MQLGNSRSLNLNVSYSSSKDMDGHVAFHSNRSLRGPTLLIALITSTVGIGTVRGTVDESVSTQ